MTVRLPLVLNGIIVSELKLGDTLRGVSKSISITKKDGRVVDVPFHNGPVLPILNRDGERVNIILEI